MSTGQTPPEGPFDSDRPYDPEYEPQRRAAYAAPPPPPQKPKRKWLKWVVIGAILLTLLLVGGCLAAIVGAVDGTEDPGPVATAGPDSPKAQATPTKEAKPYTAAVTKCEPGDFEFDVTVKIKNNTDQDTTYIFDLLLLDKDENTVGDGMGSVEVKAKRSATTTLVALLDDSYKGKKSAVKCEVKVTDF